MLCTPHNARSSGSIFKIYWSCSLSYCRLFRWLLGELASFTLSAVAVSGELALVAGNAVSDSWDLHAMRQDGERRTRQRRSERKRGVENKLLSSRSAYIGKQTVERGSFSSSGNLFPFSNLFESQLELELELDMQFQIETQYSFHFQSHLELELEFEASIWRDSLNSAD